jgi:hypothetical protein
VGQFPEWAFVVPNPEEYPLNIFSECPSSRLDRQRWHANHIRGLAASNWRRMLLALPCRPFQYEKDSVENLNRVVYREGHAYVIDSRMQIATWFGERVGVWRLVQVKSQVRWRLLIGEDVMVPE